MEYKKLVAVTGMPGLFELINSKTDGAIVRSLDDQSTRFVSSRIHNFSQLESIEVFTTGENVNLAEVFFAMEKTTGALPDTKDDAVIRAYFQKTFPPLDLERVYVSDLKKMIKWFEVLKKHNIEVLLPEEPVEEPVEEPPVVEQKNAPQPAKKITAADHLKPSAKEKKPAKSTSSAHSPDEKKSAAKTKKK